MSIKIKYIILIIKVIKLIIIILRYFFKSYLKIVENMSENQLISKITQKNPKKFARILRNLAQSENLLTNILKVTISEGEVIEEEKKILIAPLKFKSYSNPSVEQNSTDNTINKKSNVKIENYSPLAEKADYPDSSDFSDDE